MIGCIVASCQNNPPKTEKQKKQEKLQEEISSLDTLIESTITELKNDPLCQKNDKETIDAFGDFEVFFEEMLKESKESIEKLAKKIEKCEQMGQTNLHHGYKTMTVIEAKKELEFQQKKIKFFELLAEKNKKEKELMNSLPKKADKKQ
jgi:hypothetical protein